ncbi:MAG: extracellular solute-binding protein [Chloroflexota bacterium]
MTCVVRIVSLIFVVALFSACTLTSPTPMATTPNAVEPVTISFAAKESARDTYMPLIEAFEAKNPHIQIRFESLNTITEITDTTSNHSNPQLVQTVHVVDTAAVSFVTPDDIPRGYLRNLTPFIDTDLTFQRDDYHNGALEALSQDSNIYLLPHTHSVPLMSYNKELWNQSELPPPTPDLTWQDLMAAVEQIASTSSNTDTIYGTEGAFIEFISGLNERTEVLTTPIDQISLDDPTIATLLEEVIALTENGVIYEEIVHSGQEFDMEALQQLILDQRLGIWSPDILSFLPPEQQPDFEIGTIATPPIPMPFFWGSAPGFIMSNGTQHPGEAWRWLSFLSQQPGPFQVEVTQVPSHFPARKSIAEQVGYWDKLDDEAEVVIQTILERPDSGFDHSFDERLYMTLYSALYAALSGEQTPEEALQDAQTMLEDNIAQAQTQAQPVGTPEPFVVATPMPDEAPAGAATITFGTLGFNDDQMRQIVRSFHQQQAEVFVNIDGSNAGPNRNFANTAANTDCFMWIDPPHLEQMDATLDLQPLIDADNTFVLDNYATGLLTPYQRESELHGLPYAVDLLTLAYNQELFEATGIETPDPEWTPADFQAAAQQLTLGSGDEQQYGYATTGPHPKELFFFLDRLEVSTTQGNDPVQPNFTDPRLIKAVQWYIDLLRSTSPHTQLQGYTIDSWPTVGSEAIFQGRAGMWFVFGLNSINNDSTTFTTVLTSPPLSTGTVTTNRLRMLGLHISANTNQPRACWTWLKHLTNDTSGLQGLFPANRSLITNQTLPDGATEVYAAYDEALSQSTATPTNDAMIDYFWFLRAVDRALQGTDLAEELTDAQTLTEQYLACVRGDSDGATCATQTDPEYNGLR